MITMVTIKPAVLQALQKPGYNFQLIKCSQWFTCWHCTFDAAGVNSLLNHKGLILPLTPSPFHKTIWLNDLRESFKMGRSLLCQQNVQTGIDAWAWNALRREPLQDISSYRMFQILKKNWNVVGKAPCWSIDGKSYICIPSHVCHIYLYLCPSPIVCWRAYAVLQQCLCYEMESAKVFHNLAH